MKKTCTPILSLHPCHLYHYHHVPVWFLSPLFCLASILLQKSLLFVVQLNPYKLVHTTATATVVNTIFGSVMISLALLKATVCKGGHALHTYAQMYTQR
jgi:hypothetical protein